MKPIKDLTLKNPKWLFTDIDDTLTTDGQLTSEAYTSLWQLQKAGVHVIPITGRPAGWCELIARQWPVAGVVGENGAFYFRYHERKMKRHFVFDESTRKDNQKKLEAIKAEILSSIEGAALASDQFCRLFDLAIDFCEDVEPLPDSAVDEIVGVFKKYGATAKISSIHVNGWFGEYDKLTMCKKILESEFQTSAEQEQGNIIFVGDSLNDEPMFEYFHHSVAVANIKKFEADLKAPPKYVCKNEGGKGFAELTQHILK